MTVAICTDGIYPLSTGGMQKHSRLLVESLAVLPGIQLVVIHPHPHRIFDFPNVNEVLLAPIDTTKNYLMECFRYSQRVSEQLRLINPTVIYSQGLSVWSDIERFRERLIINPHGLEPFQALGVVHKIKAIPFKWIFRYLFNKAARVVSLGGNLTSILKKQMKEAERIACIPNAVKLPNNSSRVSKNMHAGPVEVLFLGRFASNKGIDILFQAIDQLHQRAQLEKFNFKLGGKGPLYDYYKSGKKYSQVELLGFVPDDAIEALYQGADLFVLPTLFEGMPTVVLEAMSYQLPIIVSDVGATSEQVDASNGFLLPPNNVEALVNSLLMFQALPDEQKEAMGRMSFNKVANSFTWEMVAKKHVHLFHEVAAATAS